MAQLDEGSSIPLYAQLRDLIKSQIEDGTFGAGERIPSEDQLNTLYGVSRITVRRALKELVDVGYLVKRPGKGTYVSDAVPCASAPRKVAAKFAQNNDVEAFTEACRSNGFSAGARVVSCSEVEGIEAERAFFGFGREGHLVRVERVRTADDTPIMVEENYFPLDRYRFILDADLENTSLFEIVKRNGLGDPSMKEPCQLDIDKASPRLAGLLEVPAGEPLFSLSGRYFDARGDAMYLGREYIVGSRYTFRI